MREGRAGNKQGAEEYKILAGDEDAGWSGFTKHIMRKRWRRRRSRTWKREGKTCRRSRIWQNGGRICFSRYSRRKLEKNAFSRFNRMKRRRPQSSMSSAIRRISRRAFWSSAMALRRAHRSMRSLRFIFSRRDTTSICRSTWGTGAATA